MYLQSSNYIYCILYSSDTECSTYGGHQVVLSYYIIYLYSLIINDLQNNDIPLKSSWILYNMFTSLDKISSCVHSKVKLPNEKSYTRT